MSLDLQDIERIAHLARLQVQPDEAERLMGQLNGFFGIVEAMRAVDATGVEPLAHPLAAARKTSAAPPPWKTACFSCPR